MVFYGSTFKYFLSVLFTLALLVGGVLFRIVIDRLAHLFDALAIDTQPLLVRLRI